MQKKEKPQIKQNLLGKAVTWQRDTFGGSKLAPTCGSFPARPSSFQITSYPRLFQTFFPRIGNDMDQEKLNQWANVFQQQKICSWPSNFILRNYVIKVFLSPGSRFKTKRVGLKESIHNMYEYIWVFHLFMFPLNIRVCF